MSPDIIGIGESLIQFNAVVRGPLRHVTLFEKHVAGAETNVVVCARRQGLTSGMITKVGNDEFGKSIVNWLRGEGVDVSQIKVDPEAPTGIYFVQRGFPIPSKSRMFYYRSNSAGSRLAPDDIDQAYIKSAKIIHVTGITPAISQSASDATFKAIEFAHRHGVKVSFDTNIRPALWKSTDKMVQTLTAMAEKATILFTDLNDAAILFESKSIDDVVDAALGMGVEVVVVKMGEKGGFAATKSERARAEALPVYVEDPVGAGDAFAGTFITSWIKGRSLQDCLRRATIAGSLVVTVRGDEECIPSEEDIDANINKP